jgi:hypothetical protein
MREMIRSQLRRRLGGGDAPQVGRSRSPLTLILCRDGVSSDSAPLKGRGDRRRLRPWKWRLAGASLYKSMFFTKRTQMKNVQLFRCECVRKKYELGSFCKKRQKTGGKCWKTAPGSSENDSEQRWFAALDPSASPASSYAHTKPN